MCRGAEFQGTEADRDPQKSRGAEVLGGWADSFSVRGFKQFPRHRARAGSSERENLSGESPGGVPLPLNPTRRYPSGPHLPGTGPMEPGFSATEDWCGLGTVSELFATKERARQNYQYLISGDSPVNCRPDWTAHNATICKLRKGNPVRAFGNGGSLYMVIMRRTMRSGG